MAFTPITLFHTFLNSDGSPAAGTVTFLLSGRMDNSGVSYMPDQSLDVVLDNTGSFSQIVPATDDLLTLPQGQTWLVTIAIVGAREETYTINVPALTIGGTIDLMLLFPFQQEVG